LKKKNLTEEFGIPDISYLSFVRKTSSNLVLSASDAVFAVSALSEIGDIVQSPHFSSFFAVNDLSMNESEENMAKFVLTSKLLSNRGLSLSTTTRERWEHNFWVAFDGLSPTNPNHSTLLREGLQLAMSTQRAVVRHAVELVKRKVIIRSGPFRYCLLTHHESESSHDLALFSHPLALTQLASFLTQTFHDSRAVKPFLIGALNENKHTYLVLGMSSSSSGAMNQNRFGYFFREASSKTQAEIVVHMFDKYVAIWRIL
jgi:hypothetical protein